MNSALTFPDDKDNPTTAVGQLLWEWTGQYLCFRTCTFKTSRFNVTWALSDGTALSHSLLLLPLLTFWIFPGLVWVVFILALFVFALPCCAAALTYGGMSSHILATASACCVVDFFWSLISAAFRVLILHSYIYTIVCIEIQHTCTWYVHTFTSQAMILSKINNFAEEMLDWKMIKKIFCVIWCGIISSLIAHEEYMCNCS